MIYKILKNIISCITVIIAIGYLIYSICVNSNNFYETMILSLLILISTTFILEGLDEKRKWENIDKDIMKRISSISNCQISTYDNTKDWVDEMINLTKEGTHTFYSAALDNTTRSKSKPQYSSIWGYLNKCSREERIIFRHILRIRKNNLRNLLDRIAAGSAKKNSYFAYYELPSGFSFPAFGIIDEKYIATRSPYQQGASPCYMIIDNGLIAQYFVQYFDELWNKSNKIESVTTLRAFLTRFESEYSSEEIKYCQDRIDEIEKEGIIDDI